MYSRRILTKAMALFIDVTYSLMSATHSKHRQSSLLLFLLLQVFLFVGGGSMVQRVSAKNLEDSITDASINLNNVNVLDTLGGIYYQHRRRRFQRDVNSRSYNDQEQCNNVKNYFESINIEINENYDNGSICKGNCCSNSTETKLRNLATTEFERLLHHHTNSLRSILESTVVLFQNHVLELVQQSENKTLNVFSKVYRKMMPLSRKLIHQLYSDIISHLNNKNNYNSYNSSHLEDAIHDFFVNLFPVAYHQAVHISKDNFGDLHEDYINCLKHTFVDLHPFGTIPIDIKRTLTQSVQSATVFMSSLLQSAEVLGEADGLYIFFLSENCQKHLLKMNYCPSCKNLEKIHVKTCYSYCMNVLRGCSAHYAGILDGPWSNVVDAIDNLVTSHIRSDSGIVTTIKHLDGKLSETIMCAMENGPELEKKVKKTCGTPKLIPSISDNNKLRPFIQHNNKWVTPPDAEILRFLSAIYKSKDFYSNMVNNACEDENIQRNDHYCWTGERIGDYTQLVMTSGVDTQRYNPEVPLEVNSLSTKLNEIVDKLIKIRKNIVNAIPSAKRIYSDIQSDMAGNDEEGSGIITDGMDDEEFVGNINGSGDGSGDDLTPLPFDPIGPTVFSSNEDSSRSAATLINLPTFIILTLVTIIYIESK